MADYAIDTAEVVCACSEFCVQEFNPLFSDVHNPLEIIIPYRQMHKSEEEIQSMAEENSVDCNKGLRDHLRLDWTDENIVK